MKWVHYPHYKLEILKLRLNNLPKVSQTVCDTVEIQAHKALFHSLGPLYFSFYSANKGEKKGKRPLRHLPVVKNEVRALTFLKSFACCSAHHFVFHPQLFGTHLHKVATDSDTKNIYGFGKLINKLYMLKHLSFISPNLKRIACKVLWKTLRLKKNIVTNFSNSPFILLVIFQLLGLCMFVSF